MGLPWVRLDTSVPDNPKILGLLTERAGKGAAFVWICCMCYAGKHGTDGFIPREALSRVNGTAAEMRLLVKNDALKEVAGGWEIPGWDEFQLSDEDAKKRREKAQRAAAARWSKSENARNKRDEAA